MATLTRAVILAEITAPRITVCRAVILAEITAPGIAR